MATTVEDAKATAEAVENAAEKAAKKAAKKAVTTALQQLHTECGKFGRTCVTGISGVRRSPMNMVQMCEAERMKCWTSYGDKSDEYRAICSKFTAVTEANTTVFAALATLDAKSAKKLNDNFANLDIVNGANVVG